MQQPRPTSSGGPGPGPSYQMNGAPPNAPGQAGPSVLQPYSGGQIRKRSTSPTGNEGKRPSKMARSIDLRAEEEAARRLNMGRVGTAMVGRTKETDLFGRLEIRSKLDKLAKDHNVTWTDDTLSYLALATESRLRTLLGEAVAAQIHRTTSHHLHVPPAGKSGKPMWNTRILNDTSAVLEALARQNREAEQTFRANRMDRIAKETQMARAREAREKAAEEATPAPPPSAVPEVNGTESGPSTPRPGATPAGDGDGDGKASTGKKKSSKKAAKDLNADLSLKMSNATAMRSAGFKQGKYSWLTSVPNIPSPLGGKKGKGKGASSSEDAEGSEVEDGTGKVKSEPGGQVNGHGHPPGSMGHKKSKSKLRDSSRPQRSRVDVTAPPRRMVLVGSGGGAEKRVSDDKALTLVDVLFALDRDGVGRGMGTADEIARKAWAKPGGPWRHDGR